MKKLALLLLVYSILVSATEYHVSNSGQDTNPGTLAEPFQTIQKAASLMNAGDICIIHGGVYREVFIPAHSGSVGTPVLFTNYEDEPVIISGLDVVSDWVHDESNIWKTPMNQEVTQVFINGARLNKARYPNMGLTMFDVQDWAEINLSGNRTGTMQGISSLGDLQGARIVGLCGNKWVTVTGVISSNSGESFSVNQASHQWSSSGERVYLGDGHGFLVQHKTLLDVPNEWFYDGEYLYIIPPDDVNPNSLLIEARVRFRGANLNNSSHIHLKGLHFKAANITMRNAEGCLVDECSVRYPMPFFVFANGFNRDSKNADNWDGNGVEISGSNSIIKNSYIAHSWGDGVTMWGTDNRLENCLVEDCDWMAVDSAPLSVTGRGHIIKNNTLRKSGRSILVHRHLAAAEIIYNDMHDCGLMTDDLGLTYSFQTDGDGTVIAYNRVHDNNASHTGPGIYLDNGDANYLVHHNVVWNCGEGIRLNLPQTNTDVFNNTFWNNQKPMDTWGPAGTELIDCRVWNNIQDHAQFIGNDRQNNLYTQESMFVDVENFDFRLVEDAEAIDYGRIIPGITGGYTGDAPDAGAYEFGDSWTAGASIEPPTLDDSLPIAPTGFKGEVQQGRIRLTWIDNSTNELGFAIDRRQGSRPFAEIAIVGANVTAFVDSTIKPTTTYSYRIRAFNNAGSNLSTDFITLTSLGDGSAIRLEAENYNKMSGINNNGDHIGGCDNGDYVMFENFDFGEGYDVFSTRCAVPDEYANQTMLIRIDQRRGTIVARFKVQSTGGWNDFQEQSVAIDRVTGVHDLYFVFSGGSGVGNFDWFQFTRETTDVQDSKHKNLTWRLGQNYPNPFNPTTTITYHLVQPVTVELEVFDLRGRRIETLVDRIQSAGQHAVEFNTASLASGAYFYKIQAGDFSAVRKMMVVK